MNIISRYITATTKVLDRVYRAELRNTRLHIRKKPGGKEWGYYINPDFGDVVQYMVENDLNSFIDLGAGAGHIMEIMRLAGYKVRGYENEPALIEEYEATFLAKHHNNFLFEKDIMTLSTEDIRGFEVLYAWQPFRDLSLLNIFIDKTISIMTPDQVFLLKVNNSTWKSPENLIKNESIYIYKK
jgi:hypothetical protein